MRRSDVKGRIIKFRSQKNDCVMIVTTEDARAYCRYLEEDDLVESYEPDYRLDQHRVQIITHAGIRKDYFEQSWVSDFYIKRPGGSEAVRELISPNKLDQLSEVEKRELSRRYWSSVGVTDWKIVLTDFIPSTLNGGE